MVSDYCPECRTWVDLGHPNMEFTLMRYECPMCGRIWHKRMDDECYLDEDA